MTDISAIQSTSNSSAATAKKSSTASSADMLSSDFETFLKMMTAQVQNQDPMNPMDSSEYASQLATFSSVEQQVLTNDLLKEMGDMLGGNALQQFGSWVGMDVLASAPAYYAGEPVSLRPEFANGAEKATLVVRNSDNEIVQKLEFPVGQEEVLWAGIDDAGVPFPNGIYQFEVQSHKGGELLDTTIASHYDSVEEVRNQGSSVTFTLSSGIEVAPSDVSGLRSGV